MRLIKNWRNVLIIAVAVIAIAIPIAARVSPTQTKFVEPARVNLDEPAAAYTEVAKIAKTYNSKSGSSHRAAPPQDYYDRRRQHWEERMERRADYLEQEDGDDDGDAADTEDSKDSKESASDDDEGDSMGDEEEMIEQRREYWRERLDRDW